MNCKSMSCKVDFEDGVASDTKLWCIKKEINDVA